MIRSFRFGSPSAGAGRHYDRLYFSSTTTCWHGSAGKTVRNMLVVQHESLGYLFKEAADCGRLRTFARWGQHALRWPELGLIGKKIVCGGKDHPQR